MSEHCHEETYRGYSVKIYQDEAPEDPRKHAEPLGTLAVWHSGYRLGDLGDNPPRPADYLRGLAHDATGEDYEDATAAELLAVVGDHYIILPVALLDHSGLWMYLGSGAHTSDPGGWDSGQAGWISVSLEDVRKEYGDDGDEARARARACLEAEVEAYNWWLTSNVYGYVAETPDGGHVDSCSGYYGGPQDGDGSNWSYMLDEARAAIDHEITRARARHAWRLRSWTRHRVPYGYREACPATAAGH